MELIKEQERICRELGNKGGLQRTLGNQALILRARGDWTGPWRSQGTGADLPRAGEQGRAAGIPRQPGADPQDRGDLDGAMALIRNRSAFAASWGTRTDCRHPSATRR